MTKIIPAVKIDGHRLLLGAILLLAAALRLYDPGLSEFKYDEARVFAQAKAVAQGRSSLIIGQPTSVGLPDTPRGWPIVLTAGLSPHDPSLSVLLLAFLGVLAVALTYFIGARFFSPRAGLVAALLFATDPWAVFFSRKIWHHNLPLLTALALLFAGLWLIERRPGGVVGSLAAIAAQIQTHLSGILYLPATALTLILFWRRLSLLTAAAGILSFLLISLPYLLFIFGSGFERLPLVAEGTSGSWLIPDPQALRLGFWILSGENLEAALGAASNYLSAFSQLLPLATWFLGILLLVGILGSGQVIRDRGLGWEAYALAILWLASTWAPLIFHPFPLFMHYFILLFPMVFLTAAIGWETAFANRRGFLKWGGVILLVLVAGLQSAAMWNFYAIVDGENTAGGFGVPLKDWVALANGVRQEVEVLGSREVAVITEGTDPLYEEWPSRFSALLQPDLDLRFLGRGGTEALLFREDKALLYLETRQEPILEETLLRWGQERGAETLADGTLARLIYFSPRTGAELREALDLVPVAARFENGAELVGYRVLDPIEPSATWRVQVLWHFGPLDEAEKARDWQVFNHFVDTQGNKWAQADGFGLASAAWREGDWVLQWVELTLPPDLPPGEYFLQTGMYSLVDGTRSLVTDASGNPVTDLVELGPL